MVSEVRTTICALRFGANALTLPINGIKGEVVATIKKQQYYLWRAVDSKGNVLDVLLQRHRYTKAAKRFVRKLLKKQGFAPRVILTDKLKSYEAAKKQVLKSVEHRYSQRIEQSSRELPPTDSNARKTDAKVQIPRKSATISLCFWTDSRPLPSETTSTHCDSAIVNRCANELQIGEKLLN
jgi:putative transposase